MLQHTGGWEWMISRFVSQRTHESFIYLKFHPCLRFPRILKQHISHSHGPDMKKNPGFVLGHHFRQSQRLSRSFTASLVSWSLVASLVGPWPPEVSESGKGKSRSVRSKRSKATNMLHFGYRCSSHIMIIMGVWMPLRDDMFRLLDCYSMPVCRNSLCECKWIEWVLTGCVMEMLSSRNNQGSSPNVFSCRGVRLPHK